MSEESRGSSLGGTEELSRRAAEAEAMLSLPADSGVDSLRLACDVVEEAAKIMDQTSPEVLRQPQADQDWRQGRWRVTALALRP